MDIIECYSKLKLREIRAEDTNDILRLRNDPRIRDRFIYRKNITREIHNKWLQEQIQTKNAIQYIIIDNYSERIIGSTYLKNINWIDNNAEYGIVLGADLDEDCEYEKEIGDIILQYAFYELNLHKVYVKVFPKDGKIISLYESMGFVQEGILIKDVYVDGEYKDIIRMGKVM